MPRKEPDFRRKPAKRPGAVRRCVVSIVILAIAALAAIIIRPS